MPSSPLCVYCRRRAQEAPYRPFCSDRCKMADLGQWLGGAYAVPGESASAADQPVSDVEDVADNDGWRR